MQATLSQGVTLDVIATEQFKTTGIMIDFVAPITAENASRRTLLAQILETSSAKYQTAQQLSQELSRMFGASFGINVLKVGNQHVLRIEYNMVNDRFLDQATVVDGQLLKDGIDFLREIIFNPLIHDGQFDEATFSRQRTNLIASVHSLNDDKQYYANAKLQQLYYADMPEQGFGALGNIDQVAQLTPAEIYQTYQEMLANDQIHVAVIGDVATTDVATTDVETLFKAFPFIDRKPVVGLPLVAQPALTDIRQVTEEAALMQSKLNMMYQLPVMMNDPDYYAAVVFNGIFGGTPLSMLFTNVREKASLAYYASSSFSGVSGSVAVQTGIEGQNEAQVIEIIDQQLQAIVAGDFSQTTFNNVKASLANGRKAAQDSPRQRLSRALFARISGQRRTLTESLDHLEAVSASDVAQVATKLKKQTIFFLNGTNA